MANRERNHQIKWRVEGSVTRNDETQPEFTIVLISHPALGSARRKGEGQGEVCQRSGESGGFNYCHGELILFVLIYQDHEGHKRRRLY